MSNRFYVQDEDISDEPLNEMNGRIGNKHVIIRSKRKMDIDKVQNVNHIYASNYPDRNTLALHKMGKLPSYNANQPIKSIKRKKIAIISDSIKR